VVKVVPAAQSEAQAAQERRDREAQSKIDRNMLLTNIALAVFACLQLVITAITLRGLKHAETAAQAADAAADASKRAVEIATDTAQRQLRAYVVVGIGVLEGATENGQPTGRVVVQNVGQTPAYQVSTDMEIAVVSEGQNFNVLSPDDVKRVHMVIGAGHSVRTSQKAAFSLTAEGLAAVQAGTSAIFISGCTVYEDIFGKTWSTQFCHIYRGADLGGAYYEEKNLAT